METSSARAIHDPAADFYIDALKKLQETGIPFLVGGAFAFSHYSNIPRDTKDIDVFVRPPDCLRGISRRLGFGRGHGPDRLSRGFRLVCGTAPHTLMRMDARPLAPAQTE